MSSKANRKNVRSSGKLASYISSFTFNDIPEPIVERTKWLVLDLIGVAVAATTSSLFPSIRRYAEMMNTAGAALIWGTNHRCGSSVAAFCNAASAQVNDFNDGHRVSASNGGLAHPGRTIIPTVIAEAETLHLTGKDVITAVVAGYDLACKPVSSVMYRGHRVRPSQLYAAAGAVAKLRGASAEQMARTLNVAVGHVAPGSPSSYWTSGYRAQRGIEAATGAHFGQQGQKIVQGLDEEFNHGGWGSSFEVMNTYIKPYPACRMIHSSIDAILTLRQLLGPFLPQDIRSILIKQIPKGMYVAKSKPPANIKARGAQANIYYCVARAVLDGHLTLDQFSPEKIADPQVRRLIQTIAVEADADLGKAYPANGRPAVVELELHDGREACVRVDYPVGDPKNPLSEEHLIEKFERNVQQRYGQQKIDRIIDCIHGLDKLSDISELTKLLVTPDLQCTSRAGF